MFRIAATALLVASLLPSCAPAPDGGRRPAADAASLQTEAQQAMEAEDAARAVELLLAATQERPEDASLWNDLGLAREAAGDWQGAVRSYEQAIRIQPTGWRPHLNLAVLCMRHGISGRAQSEFEEAVQADPLNPVIEWNYAVALVDIGEPAQARQHLLRALEHDPQHGDSYAELARVETLQGEIDQSLQHFARAGSLGVSNPAYHANYGVALLRAERWEQAERQLRLATEMKANEGLVWSNLGVARLQRGRNKEAIAAFREARVLEPANEDYRYNLASALARTGDHAGVITLLETPPPKRADLLALQGMSLRGMGRVGEAVGVLQQAAQKAPRNVDILNNLGVVQAESGDVGAARATWLRVLEIAPSNETARKNLQARPGSPGAGGSGAR